MSVGKGISEYLQKGGRERAKQGNCLQPVVLADLQGKGLCGKEAFLLKAFLVTFVATKVTKPSGN